MKSDESEEEYEQIEDIDIINLEGVRDHLLVRVVPDDKRITSSILQLEEATQAIGVRAAQIERGSPVYTDTTGLNDPISMAKKELIDRKNPLILERTLFSSGSESIVEHWKVNDMVFIDFDKLEFTPEYIARKKLTKAFARRLEGS